MSENGVFECDSCGTCYPLVSDRMMVGICGDCYDRDKSSNSDEGDTQ